MFKKFIITCDEATQICDKTQYNEGTLLEKIKLNFHFLQCKICRLYTRQNSKMTLLYKIKASDCKEHKRCLSQLEKEALLKEFNKVKV